MRVITISGRLGEDAKHKSTANSEFCSFRVAADEGFGDNKTTLWFDVTRWGKGAAGLAEILVKGMSVTVSGSLGTREHEGRTYLQINADRVDPHGGRSGNAQSQSARSHGNTRGPADDDEDFIPFIRCEGVF